MGFRTSQSFGSKKSPVGELVLKCPKGWAMDCVNDAGNPRTTGCQPSKDACLATVGVNNHRALPEEPAIECPISSPVPHGSNLPDQSRFDTQAPRKATNSGLEGSFWPSWISGARDELDLFKARLGTQSKDGGNGIFLGAPNNQASDEMNDSHQNQP
jgi:hypothetical protein